MPERILLVEEIWDTLIKTEDNFLFVFVPTVSVGMQIGRSASQWEKD